MAKIFALVCVLFALQGCLAKPSQQAEKTVVEVLATKTTQLFDDVGKQIEKELPDSKKVVEVLNTQTQNTVTAIQTMLTKLKEEAKAHQGEVDNVSKQVQAKLSEVATTLQKAAGPEATAKATELQTTLDTNLKTVVGQIEKLYKDAEPKLKSSSDSIFKWAQESLNDLVKVGKDLQTQVKTQIEEHEKTHKH